MHTDHPPTPMLGPIVAGTKIYYTGNADDVGGLGNISNIVAGGTGSVATIALDDGRTMNVPITWISRQYSVTGLLRFVTPRYKRLKVDDMSDYDTPIAEVQALVGCPHKWDLVDDSIWGYWNCLECSQGLSKTKCEDLPIPAPDCSTPLGVISVAGLHQLWLSISTSPTGKRVYVFQHHAKSEGSCETIFNIATEREACTAICELILKTVEDGGKSK